MIASIQERLETKSSETSLELFHSPHEKSTEPYETFQARIISPLQCLAHFFGIPMRIRTVPPIHTVPIYNHACVRSAAVITSRPLLIYILWSLSLLATINQQLMASVRGDQLQCVIKGTKNNRFKNARHRENGCKQGDQFSSFVLWMCSQRC